MQIIKYVSLFLVLLGCTLLGRFLSRKYINRLKELEEMKNALHMLKTKIKFTYDPIPEIFDQISQNINSNMGFIFKKAKENMEDSNASIAWNEAIKTSNTNLTKDDKYVLQSLSKLLGQTDVEGQVGQIEVTEKFLETQIKEAQIERQKNEKLYSKLGTTIGFAIVIILC